MNNSANRQASPDKKNNQSSKSRQKNQANQQKTHQINKKTRESNKERLRQLWSCFVFRKVLYRVVRPIVYFAIHTKLNLGYWSYTPILPIWRLRLNWLDRERVIIQQLLWNEITFTIQSQVGSPTRVNTTLLISANFKGSKDFVRSINIKMCPISFWDLFATNVGSQSASLSIDFEADPGSHTLSLSRLMVNIYLYIPYRELYVFTISRYFALKSVIFLCSRTIIGAGRVLRCFLSISISTHAHFVRFWGYCNDNSYSDVAYFESCIAKSSRLYLCYYYS